MLIIGIDPGVSGSICFFQNGKIEDVIDMPTMADGKKNKKQVNGSQIFNEISKRIIGMDRENIKVDKKEISDEHILELAINSGAEECISYENYHEIHCSINEIYNVKKELEKTIYNFISTEIEWIPLNNINIQQDMKELVIEFLETLENDDDVQSIFSNVKIGEN